MRDTLSELDWDFIRRCSPDEGTVRLTETILSHAKEIIGKRECKEVKSSHPWLTNELTTCIKLKHEAEGTCLEKEKNEDCSKKIMAARAAFNIRTKAKLNKLKDKPKQWWKENNLLLGAPAKICSIPALKDSANNWVLDASDKATLIATTLKNKCVLSPEEKTSTQSSKKKKKFKTT